MDKQVGRPVLVEFWDFCRANSLRTLPYVKAWHERYAAAGPARDLRAHARASRRPATRTRCAPRSRGSASSTRSASTPTASCGALREPGLAGALPLRPAARAWSTPLRRGRLRRDRARDPGAARRRARRAGAACAPRTTPRRSSSSRRPNSPARTRGPYEAGGVWAVLDGRGRGRRSTATRVASAHPGAPLLAARAPHRRRARSRVGEGVTATRCASRPGCAPGAHARAGGGPRRAGASSRGGGAAVGASSTAPPGQ